MIKRENAMNTREIYIFAQYGQFLSKIRNYRLKILYNWKQLCDMIIVWLSLMLPKLFKRSFSSLSAVHISHYLWSIDLVDLWLPFVAILKNLCYNTSNLWMNESIQHMKRKKSASKVWTVRLMNITNLLSWNFKLLKGVKKEIVDNQISYFVNGFVSFYFSEIFIKYASSSNYANTGSWVMAFAFNLFLKKLNFKFFF